MTAERLRWRPPASATSTTAPDPTSRSVTGHRATPTSASPVGVRLGDGYRDTVPGWAYGTVRPRGLRSCAGRSACAGDRSLPYAASAWRGGAPAPGVVSPMNFPRRVDLYAEYPLTGG